MLENSLDLTSLSEVVILEYEESFTRKCQKLAKEDYLGSQVQKALRK